MEIDFLRGEEGRGRSQGKGGGTEREKDAKLSGTHPPNFLVLALLDKSE